MKLGRSRQEKKTHVIQPVDMKFLKNLVKKNRAPFSVTDGTICFGLVRVVTISFPSRHCEAAMPA